MQSITILTWGGHFHYVDCVLTHRQVTRWLPI